MKKRMKKTCKSYFYPDVLKGSNVLELIPTRDDTAHGLHTS